MSDTAQRRVRPWRSGCVRNADGVLEQIARDYSVSTFDVVRALPEEHRAILPGSKFEDILKAVTEWGEVLFIVHTADIVLECAGKIPPGSIRPRLFQSARRQPHRRVTSRPRTAATSHSSAGPSWGARRARCSSSTRQARPCSRSSCGVTRSAICSPSRSNASMPCGQGCSPAVEARGVATVQGRPGQVQRLVEGASESEPRAPDGTAASEVLAALGAVKPVKPGAVVPANRPEEPTSTANALVLPPITPAQRRRRVAIKVAAALSIAVHAGSLYAFLAWHGNTDTGALDRPSDAISVEIVASRTLEATQPQQASEPAASPDATAPVEGKTEASNAQPVQPERKDEPKAEIVVPQPPVVIPDATEEVARTVKQETPAKSEAPPVPEPGPADIIPPPPKEKLAEDNAPAKHKQPQARGKKEGGQSRTAGRRHVEVERRQGQGRRARVGEQRGHVELCSGSACACCRQQATGRRAAGHCRGGVRAHPDRGAGVRRPLPLFGRSATRSAGCRRSAQLRPISHASVGSHVGAAAVRDPVSLPVEKRRLATPLRIPSRRMGLSLSGCALISKIGGTCLKGSQAGAAIVEATGAVACAPNLPFWTTPSSRCS